jgi:transposase InsO family protein
MDQRVQFIAAWQQQQTSFAGLCQDFGISRRTGYKWVARYQQDGITGLQERSRVPHHSPQAISGEVAALLRAARAAHPTWGPKKLLPWLERQQVGMALPAASTVGELLKREGLTVARRMRRRTPVRTAPLAHADQPNAVLTADFKGQFRLGDGGLCYPLTIMDGYSRYLVRCQALPSTSRQLAQPVFAAVFRQVGVPAVIHTDNGPPFASTGLGGLSELGVWFIRLGIVVEHSRPGHPEENGRHERMHRTLKAEATRPPEASLRRQQVRFDRFVREYNEERPHEALGQVPPAAVYVPAGRAYRPRPAPLTYPEADRVLRVRTNGEIYLHRQYIYLGGVLAGEQVGLTRLQERQWEVRFGPLLLGVLDERQGKVEDARRRGPGRGRLPGRDLRMAAVTG